jgi:hypothetical protein
MLILSGPKSSGCFQEVSMSIRRICGGLAVVALCMAPLVARAEEKAVAPTTKPAEMDVDKAFDAIKSLVGTWKGEFAGQSGTIEFKLSGGGSVVVETMFPGSDQEMTNVYHRDGDAIVVTHYCASGNQPRMQLTKMDGMKLSFTYRDCTNLASPDAMKMDELALDVKDANTLVEIWGASAGEKKEPPMEFELKRAK